MFLGETVMGDFFCTKKAYRGRYAFEYKACQLNDLWDAAVEELRSRAKNEPPGHSEDRNNF